LLAQHEPLVLDEIERKKKIAAYGLCVNDTTTNAIHTEEHGRHEDRRVAKAQAAIRMS